MAKLTKKREGDCWRVYHNGKRTLLIVAKETSPFNGSISHAVLRQGIFLFETSSLTATWARLQILAEAFA